MKKIVSVLLAFLFTVNPAFCKLVKLDVQNPNRSLDYFLKPYCIYARKRIETEWTSRDPRINRKLQIAFTVNQAGDIIDIRSVDINFPDAQIQAAVAVHRSGPLPPLPPGQTKMDIIAEFKSQRPFSTFDPTSKIDPLAALAVGALVGFSIWALCSKSGRSALANVGTGASNDYIWVDPYYLSDGTYVEGHYRPRPNDTVLDNWTTKGNVNPITGKPGYRNPYP